MRHASALAVLQHKVRLRAARAQLPQGPGRRRAPSVEGGAGGAERRATADAGPAGGRVQAAGGAPGLLAGPLEGQRRAVHLAAHGGCGPPGARGPSGSCISSCTRRLRRPQPQTPAAAGPACRPRPHANAVCSPVLLQQRSLGHPAGPAERRQHLQQAVRRLPQPPGARLCLRDSRACAAAIPGSPGVRYMHIQPPHPATPLQRFRAGTVPAPQRCALLPSQLFSGCTCCLANSILGDPPRTPAPALPRGREFPQACAAPGSFSLALSRIFSVAARAPARQGLVLGPIGSASLATAGLQALQAHSPGVYSGALVLGPWLITPWQGRSVKTDILRTPTWQGRSVSQIFCACPQF